MSITSVFISIVHFINSEKKCCQRGGGNTLFFYSYCQVILYLFIFILKKHCHATLYAHFVGEIPVYQANIFLLELLTFLMAKYQKHTLPERQGHFNFSSRGQNNYGKFQKKSFDLPSGGCASCWLCQLCCWYYSLEQLAGLR